MQLGEGSSREAKLGRSWGCKGAAKRSMAEEARE